ncbi:P2Y purinoceptor 2 isoform X1 [Archocentrus centrarchus]|uniref:P2Y purinoceptor 2 isoform X1 n=1 Tax=Archocentrus centrarchus TaxID=63155 RepID=UPI0011E9E5CC|nr:P2Y purinoceptor 2 isoform X1 [Archocentrus centrarchus]XP_030600909.1 P2Y purinoceptor 2 isoform X1 [Archocentrus centrarchus]XP_030600910.1 P2Y purinoceptor 2 isoform X1 [Archocentrus centrarchus]
MVTVYNNETNQTNSSAYYCRFDDSFKYILLPVSYTLVFVIGLALNATALYVIVFRTKRWKPSTIYMFNLTVCDTLYIFTLPFLIFYYADKNDWPFSEPFCKFIRFLFYANLYGSILFLSCISLHRFVGICYPVRSLSWVSVRQARLVSVVVWTCVLFCQAPVLYFSRTRDVNSVRICHDTTIPELFDDFLIYSSVVSVLMFALPFVVLMVCYSLMVRKLLEPGWGFEGRTEEERGGLTAQRFKQKSVKMIIIVLAAFMLCFLPFHLTRSLHYIFRYLRQVNPAQISCNLLNSSNVAYKITRPLASANSCVDPILYFLAGQDARSNFPKRCKLQSPKAKTGSQNLTTKL